MLIRFGFIFSLTVIATATAGDLFPPELVEFEPYSGNPVFERGEPGTWDERIQERGWILKEDDGYHLWYTGHKHEYNATMQLGYATSPDGIHWMRYPGNPLPTVRWVEDMMVVKHVSIGLSVGQNLVHILIRPYGPGV